MIRKFCFLVSIFIFSFCTRDRFQTIEPEIVPYVNTFFLEANNRGLNIDIRDYNFSIIFTDIKDPTISGNCYQGRNLIYIDSSHWERKNNARREALIFHELGHCILDRGHDEKASYSGECLSYMSSHIPVPESCSTNLFSSLWRKYYLDELFGISSELPHWRTKEGMEFEEENYYQVFLDTLIQNSSLDQEFVLSSDNYVIEMEYSDINYDLFGFQWYGYNFQLCKFCPNRTTIYTSSLVYQSSSYILSSNPIFRIKKLNEIIYFYLNNDLIHAMEFQEAIDKKFVNALKLQEVTFNLKILLF